ncbi:hypothetical protein ES703_45612 [subsurface metagenome]
MSEGNQFGIFGFARQSFNFRKVLIHRLIEGKYAFFSKLHHCHGRERLCNRADAINAIRICWYLLLDVPPSESLLPYHLAVQNDAGSCTSYTVALHGPLHCLFKFLNGRSKGRAGQHLFPDWPAVLQVVLISCREHYIRFGLGPSRLTGIIDSNFTVTNNLKPVAFNNNSRCLVNADGEQFWMRLQYNGQVVQTVSCNDMLVDCHAPHKPKPFFMSLGHHYFGPFRGASYHIGGLDGGTRRCPRYYAATLKQCRQFFMGQGVEISVGKSPLSSADKPRARRLSQWFDKFLGISYIRITSMQNGDIRCTKSSEHPDCLEFFSVDLLLGSRYHHNWRIGTTDKL